MQRFFIHRTIVQIYFNSRRKHLHSPVRSLHLFACHGNTAVQKTFTTGVGQMQRQRHHMTARGLQLSSLQLCPLAVLPGKPVTKFTVELIVNCCTQITSDVFRPKSRSLCEIKLRITSHAISRMSTKQPGSCRMSCFALLHNIIA